MQVNLTSFCNAAGTIVNVDGAEAAIAKAFAAAANVTPNTHQRLSTPATVRVEFYLRSTHASWNRQGKDELLRCVDRATARICPALDVLQYISEASPLFQAADTESGHGKLRVAFQVMPSAALLPPAALKPHTVEGEAVEGVALPTSPDGSEVAAAAALETMKDTLSDMDLWNRARAAHQLYDSSISLDSIQQLTRNGTSKADERNEESPQDAQRKLEEKVASLQWQLSRWLAELFQNDSGWARSKLSSPPSTAAATHANHKAHVEAAVTRRLFHAPLRPVYSHVVDAALYAGGAAAATAVAAPRRQLHADVRGIEFEGLLVGYTSRYAYIGVPYFVSAAESTSAALRSPGSSCVWSVVGRVPVPACVCRDMGESAVHQQKDSDDDDGEEEAEATSRKRSRSTHGSGVQCATSQSVSNGDAAMPADIALARKVLARCFNVDEAMQHDSRAATTFRLTEVPYVVTVRAHRVYCARADPSKQPSPETTARGTTPLCAKRPHPAASPYALSMMFADAYATATRPAVECPSEGEAAEAGAKPHWAAPLFGLKAEAPKGRTAETTAPLNTTTTATTTTAATSALTDKLHSFPDVVSVVRESCHRFVRSHERFCGIYQRCQEALKKPATSPVSSATTTKIGNPENTRAAASEGETDNKDATLGRVDEAEAAAKKDLPSHAVATQEMRLLRRAEAVYHDISDSISVHYKKLRGAARVSIPQIRTVADIADLEESFNIEFKARVGPHPQAWSQPQSQPQPHTSTVNTERLRNTIAAMASCRGGVILIGVADDGRVVGHDKNREVAKRLRTSGFCPAMVKDAVQVKELRLLQAAGTASLSKNKGDDVPAPPAKRAMPENWWKSGGGSGGSSNTSNASLGAAKSSCVADSKATASAAPELVVTVISVEKGQAPFYATAKNTPPYQRGCASTVVMPVVVLARRLLKELA